MSIKKLNISFIQKFQYIDQFPILLTTTAESMAFPWPYEVNYNIKSRNLNLFKFGLISEEKKAYSNFLDAKIKLAQNQYYENSSENSLAILKKGSP